MGQASSITGQDEVIYVITFTVVELYEPMEKVEKYVNMKRAWDEKDYSRARRCRRYSV